MDEATITANLAQKVAPVVATAAPATPEVQERTDDIQPIELDELTLFKMHDYFGEIYNSTNTDNKTKLQFIFENVSEQIDSRDYITVLSRVNELERMIGTSHSENRINKLYSWMGLDRIRRNTESAMRLLHE